MIDQLVSSFIAEMQYPAAVFAGDGTLKKMNSAYQSLFGIDNPAVLENHYNILDDELLMQDGRIRDGITAVFSGKPVFFCEIHYPLSKADKKYGYAKTDFLVLQATLFPVLGDKGASRQIILVLQDQREQYEKRIQLAESEKRYRTLMEALPDMLFCVAPDQTVLFVNAFSAKAFHTTPEKMIGKKLSEIFPQSVFERMWKNITQIFETKKPVYTENKTPIGENVRWLDSWLVPLSDSEGTIYAIMGVSRDITEKIKYKEELEKTRNLESLGILAGGIAHDFNNILTAIQGNISLLKETCRSCTDQFPLIEQADKAANKAKDLTAQLLTFSRGGAPVKEQASIRELILDSTGFVIHGSSVRCDFDISDDLWPCAVDTVQISQVIQNLVINAIQAMSEGGTVRVSAANCVLTQDHHSGLSGRCVRISVHDKGPGIAEENLDKVFMPFFSTKKDGKGLGLSICYSIIKRHSGFIEIDSKGGQGTTVTFYIPASTDQARDTNPVVKNAPITEMQGKRILVIDDESFVRFTTERNLLQLGTQPVLVEDGQEGLKRFRQAREEGNPFDAVILDLTIPGSAGGSAILRELQKIDPNIRAVVSSGYSNSPVLADPQAYGFRAVLRKPFSHLDVERALNQTFE